MLAKRQEEYKEEYELKQIEAEVPKAYHIPRPVLHIDWHLRSRCKLLLVLLSIMGMLVTFQSGRSASRGYDLVQIQQETTRLENDNERLKIEIAHMKSPQRIKAIAAQKLNMVIPESVYFASDHHK